MVSGTTCTFDPCDPAQPAHAAPACVAKRVAQTAVLGCILKVYFPPLCYDR